MPRCGSDGDENVVALPMCSLPRSYFRGNLDTNPGDVVIDQVSRQCTRLPRHRPGAAHPPFAGAFPPVGDTGAPRQLSSWTLLGKAHIVAVS
jgi:hypothetical protein